MSEIFIFGINNIGINTL